MVDPSQILSERNAAVEQIRGFMDLTEEAKDRRIAEVNERANAEYAEAKEAEKRGREERLKSSQRTVFNVVDDATATSAERAAAQKEEAKLHEERMSDLASRLKARTAEKVERRMSTGFEPTRGWNVPLDVPK
jgi:hypothetical protein